MGRQTLLRCLPDVDAMATSEEVSDCDMVDTNDDDVSGPGGGTEPSTQLQFKTAYAVEGSHIPPLEVSTCVSANTAQQAPGDRTIEGEPL